MQSVKPQDLSERELYKITAWSNKVVLIDTISIFLSFRRLLKVATPKVRHRGRDRDANFDQYGFGCDEWWL